MKKFKANPEYFKYPPSKISNFITLSKFDFSAVELSNNKPCIYISPKTSIIDKNLISKCIKNKFVFLNDSIVSKISFQKIEHSEQEKILSEVKNLAKQNFSLSIIYGSSPTFFGQNEPLSENLILFLKETNLDIKFLTFPGEYFAYPIWSRNPRRTKIFANQKISLSQKFLTGLSKKELVMKFNNSVPSSASSYLSKFPISMHSNELAIGLEKVLYCCPHCKKLFTIYSEFSCVKCKVCGMATEFSPDGKILFSENLSSFDDIENYQFKCLSNNDLTVNQLIQYDKITQIINTSCKKTIKLRVILQLYADKMIIVNKLTKQKITLYFEDIDFVEYFPGNKIKIETKNAKNFYFIGNSNENFLIIKDLIKLNKN